MSSDWDGHHEYDAGYQKAVDELLPLLLASVECVKSCYGDSVEVYVSDFFPEEYVSRRAGISFVDIPKLMSDINAALLRHT